MKTIIKESESSLHGFKKFDEFCQPQEINPYQDFYPFEDIMLEFKERRSILDEYHTDSRFRKSIFFGYYQLFFMFICFFIVCHPILQYLDSGKFFKDDLFQDFSKNIFQSLVVWPFFVLYSHVAFLQQKLEEKGLNTKIAYFLQIISQAVALGISFVISYFNDNWYSLTRFFVSIMCWVFFMKMYSFTAESRNLRSLKNPRKVKYSEFFYFIWVPTFIFRIEYPRNKSIDLQFLVQKAIYTVMGSLILYILITDWMYPIFENKENDDFFLIFLKLVEVCFYTNMLLFYLILETLLQCFGEATKFADRKFYWDWWNSTSYIEYMFKSNRPVNDFMVQYLYLPLQQKFKLTKTQGQLIVYTISVIVQEVVLITSLRAFKPLMIISIIVQVPLFQTLYSYRGSHTGNIFFWAVYLTILPLVITVYITIEDPLTQLTLLFF